MQLGELSPQAKIALTVIMAITTLMLSQVQLYKMAVKELMAVQAQSAVNFMPNSLNNDLRAADAHVHSEQHYIVSVAFTAICGRPRAMQQRWKLPMIFAMRKLASSQIRPVQPCQCLSK